MKKYYKYELNMTIANILALVLLVIPIVILLIFDFQYFQAISSSFFLIAMFLYFILHEMLHGAGFLIFAKDKKNIKFGITLEKGVLYAACQEKINKKAILISLLLPLIFLTIITLPIGLVIKSPLLVLLSVVNFSGAIGDILMTILIIKAPSDIEYIDYNTDIGCYLISKKDLSGYSSFGFKLAESGNEKEKQIDKSIKRLYVSKVSFIILIILLILSFIN